MCCLACLRGMSLSLSYILLHEFFEVRSCHLYVEICGRRLNVRVGDDDHDVGVGGELIDEGRELLVLHLHRHELSLALAAAQLELLDDVADL